jgi:hypothetical protein
LAFVTGLGDSIGSLEVGKMADMLILQANPSISPILTAPIRNLVPNLVYSARGDEVDTVIVNGVVIMKGALPIHQLQLQPRPVSAPFSRVANDLCIYRDRLGPTTEQGRADEKETGWVSACVFPLCDKVVRF